MEMLLDIVLDAGKDTLALVPFLFATYVALELLEHTAGDHVNGMVRRAGAAGPVVGALLGVVPQCGFSAMGATLYAGRVVTLGTLVAVFLSTSDEMLPMLMAEQVAPDVMAAILVPKMLIALVTGVVIDAVVRAVRHNARVHDVLRRTVLGSEASDEGVDVIDAVASAGEGAEHICRLCEQDRCACGHEHVHAAGGHDGHDRAHNGGRHAGGDGHGHHEGHGHLHAHGEAAGHTHDRAAGHARAYGSSLALPVLRSALSHTVQVSVFIFLVTFVLVALLETVGEDALASFIGGNELLAVLTTALVGLVPNCAASVVITQLYLEGILGYGPLMAGLLVSAGVGYLVLFRTNRRARENVLIVGILYGVAVLWGLLLGMLPLPL